MVNLTGREGVFKLFAAAVPGPLIFEARECQPRLDRVLGQELVFQTSPRRNSEPPSLGSKSAGDGLFQRGALFMKFHHSSLTLRCRFAFQQCFTLALSLHRRTRLVKTDGFPEVGLRDFTKSMTPASRVSTSRLRILQQSRLASFSGR